MCGIFGTINCNIPLEKVKPLLYHRGPDAQNVYHHKNVQLHHFRLSILDLEGGSQPMHYKNYVVIFNGEMYNHLEVREKLNLQCVTNSDTETVLHAYEKLGSKCLSYFDGMFALAIYDIRKEELFLARDRAGKKPLFLYRKDNTIVFSSELNALAKTLDLSVNEHSIEMYLRGSTYGKYTPYNNVEEVLPASSLTINCTNLKCEENIWWDIYDYYGEGKKDFDKTLSSFERIFEDAVVTRIDSSDLEVGTFLSGGIDSGLVTAFAAKHKENLKTFTVSFKGGSFDESDLAKLVADKYSTKHTEIQISFDNLKDDFDKIVSNYGEPFTDSSAIPSYYVSKEAKKYLTVILNGDGADELFGGYRRYVAFNKFDFFKSNPILKAIASPMLSVLPPSHNKKSKYNYFYRLLSLINSTGVDTYWLGTLDDFIGFENHFYKENINYFPEIDSRLKKYDNVPPAEKLMLLDFHTILQGILLPKIDIATMANSLEGRSPFMSKDVMEFSAGLHKDYKVNGTTTKYFLREMARKYLPEKLILQPKRGFEIPLKSWVNNQLNETINDYLRSDNAFYKDFIKAEFIYNLLDDTIKMPAEKRAKILYKLVCLEIWRKNQNF